LLPPRVWVDQYFNDSTGQGNHDEIDARGPWNEGDEWEFVEAPAFHDVRETVTDSASIHAESSEPADGEMVQELLVDQLRDILHAEKQVRATRSTAAGENPTVPRNPSSPANPSSVLGTSLGRTQSTISGDNPTVVTNPRSPETSNSGSAQSSGSPGSPSGSTNPSCVAGSGAGAARTGAGRQL
jgi:hypothetical protein